MDADTSPLFELDFATVCDVERQACREFFAGKANKTPERYMMIRNYMVEAWHAAQPLYLTKIKARAGLRNCGDVNAIGRIHTFLEHARIINFGAERSSSRRSQPAKSTRRRPPQSSDDDDDGWDVPRGSSSLAAVTGRRRRVRDEDGNWVDQDEYYGGRVISHDVVERHADDADYSCSGGSDEDGPARKRRRRGNHKQNGSRYQVHSEFRLVPCRSFGEAGRPFGVEISAAALALMDLHAHLMYTEVIGLLGGAYDAAAGVVRVDVAFPCNSTSTTTECEMDPASEVDARRVFALQGRHVVGWFHSHPTFDAVPSVRDIHNQHAYQALCRRDAVEPFVGVIVSPPGANAVSDIAVFFVVPADDGSPDGVPYQLPYSVVARDHVPPDAVDAMAQLVERHAAMEHRVDLARRFRRSEAMTALEKLVISLRSHWHDDALQHWDDVVSLRLRPLLQRHYCRSGSGSGSHSEPVTAPTAHHDDDDDLGGSDSD